MPLLYIDSKPVDGAVVVPGPHEIKFTTTNKSGVHIVFKINDVKIATVGAYMDYSTGLYTARATANLNTPGDVVVTCLYAEASVFNRVVTGTVKVAKEEAGPLFSGCRIPRSELKVVTGAQAATMPDISGLLIKGKFAPTVTQIGSDFIVEANAWSDYLINKPSGVAVPVYDHFLITGLERDDEGNPVRAHEVVRGLWNNINASWFEASWMNDGFLLGSGAKMRNAYVHSHSKAVQGGSEQHRDGAQMLQGGGQEVIDCLFDNRAVPQPLLADGVTPVPGTYSKAGSSSLMINHDRPIVGYVKFNGNRTIGGSSVALNITGGLVDGVEWWVKRYDEAGVLVKGLECVGNIVEQPKPTLGVVRGPRAWLAQEFGPLWHDTPVHSETFVVRNADGTFRDLTRPELIA